MARSGETVVPEMVVIVQKPVLEVGKIRIAPGARCPLVEVSIVLREFVAVEGGPVPVA